MDNLSHDITIAEKEGRYSDVIRDLYGDKNMAVTHLSSHDIYTNPITSATCTVHELKVDRASVGSKRSPAYARRKKMQTPNKTTITRRMVRWTSRVASMRPKTWYFGLPRGLPVSIPLLFHAIV